MKLPLGFTAGAVAAGLKASGNLDLAILTSDRPAVAAGVFTTSRVQAAPVRHSKRLLRRGIARAIVANAGNANACTGAHGDAVASSMSAWAAASLGIDARDILVASTGVIGVPMDDELIAKGIAQITLGRTIDPVAQAIVTTDTTLKLARTTVGEASIVAVAKGAGMIAPEMATMLCFVVTDAKVDHDTLKPALRSATAGSFDAISVDGCMSTNDTVFALANGAAGRVSAKAFGAALADVLADLSEQIVSDGEGATKVIRIQVVGARTPAMARACARSVADSVLFRCAVGGGDPNWGRILAALGASRQSIDPNAIAVTIGGQRLCDNGARGRGSLAKAAAALKRRDITVHIDLGVGDASATIATNDLTAEYVRINAEYTT